jgi:two-component sensor histidine kinase
MPERVFKHGVPPQRIRTYLVLFALALTAPLLGLAAFALNRMATLEEAETERRVVQVAGDLAADIDRELDRATVILETLATSAALRRGDFQAFHAQAVLAVRGAKSAIVLIDDSFQQLVDTLKEYGAPLPKTADLETARKVFRTKQRQVSDLFRGSISGRPVFNVEVPVLQGDKVRYVLIMSFQAAHIADLMKSAQLEPPWITGVTDNNGIILARSERHEEFVGKPLPPELLQQSRTAKGVFRATSVVGENILRATVRSQIGGWLVSATVPVSYVEAPRRRGELFATIMLATALALGGVLAYVFGAFMARPLDAAMSAADALGAGREVQPVLSPLMEANALVSRLSDASNELQRRREHAEFLMRELAHRAKNQLAVVRGMALQTANQSASVDQFVRHFSQRLQGLAESQELMVRQNWQGAWLGDLVQAQLELFAAGKRANFDGPRIFLNANAVQNIGFALHELATNASKHGALSERDGMVEVRWRRELDGRTHLTWVEAGGPPVTPPDRKGFGHLVLSQLVAQALQSTTHLEFYPQGVRWSLDIPAHHVLGEVAHLEEPLG